MVISPLEFNLEAITNTITMLEKENKDEKLNLYEQNQKNAESRYEYYESLTKKDE